MMLSANLTTFLRTAGVRWFSSTIGKRFRVTAKGKLKRRAQNNQHNTGLKRPRVAQRKRGTTELIATNRIRNTIKKMLRGIPGPS